MGAASPKNYFKTKKRYIQIGHLGHGGMAVVSESKDQYFQRTIAYKQLKDGPNLERKTDEFIREAMFMAMLEHPGILPIHELIISHEEPSAITMDKVCGLSMAQKISQAKKDPAAWPFENRMRDFQKLVEIVAYAHSRKVIHRDIKPANVMFGERGEILLLDWGLAKFRLTVDQEENEALDQRILDSARSMNGSIKGTPYYMSPEAAQGKAHLVNESSDTFGLGALLYELIALDYLIPGTKALDVLKSAAKGHYHKIDHTSMLSASSFHKKCNAELIYVLQKALKVDMNDRYQNASDMNEDMLSYLNDYPISGLGGVWSAYQIKKWIKRNFTWIIFIVMPILGIAEMLNFFESKNSRYENKITELEEKIEQEDRGLSRLKSDIVDVELQIKKTIKKNDETKDINANWNDRQKKVLINDNEKKILEIDDYIIDNYGLNLQIEEWSYEINILSDQYKMLQMKKEEFQESIRESQKVIKRNDFLSRTFLYGLEINKIRKAFEHGRRDDALFLLNHSSLLTNDIFIVNAWIRPYYESSVKANRKINQSFSISKKNDILLKPTQEPGVMSQIERQYKSEDWKLAFQHPDSDKKWFLSESGSLVLSEKGSYKKIKIEKGDIDLMLLDRETESAALRYNKDFSTTEERIVIVGSSLVYKTYIETSNQILDWSLDNHTCYLKSAENLILGYPKRHVQKWRALKNVPILEKELIDVDIIEVPKELPKGYRLLSENKKIQLIQFVSNDKSKFRNYDPYTRELVGNRSWSMDEVIECKSIKTNGQHGWWLLTDKGDVILLHSDGQSIKVVSNRKDFTTKLFTIEDKNVAILQFRSGLISVYFLNTGQYLFTPALIKQPITNVFVDKNDKIVFQMEQSFKTPAF